MQVVPKRGEGREFESSVSPKGQITIPLAWRRKLGIKPKDKVELTLEGDSVRLRPARSRLLQSFMAVPPLPKRLDWDEVTRIAAEDAADEAVKDGSPE
jgi:AbrB family looped-hinge helix DNA binding protein